MFRIENASDGLKLLHWTKELPTASAADPLGLNLRVSARLANELLYCITSITPRARYYSFFPWAFHDYKKNEQGSLNDRGRVTGILVRERAMVLGAVLHHEGRACDGGSLGGTDAAIDRVRKNLASYDLRGWKHLKAREGQFGAAYKGSLINLGVFKADVDEIDDEADLGSESLNETAQAVEVVELSPLGERLAAAFAESVRNTAYVNKGLAEADSVASDVLKQFGSIAGLCELREPGAQDRDVLRDVFFARGDERGGQRRRRMSLLLLLACIERANELGVDFNSSSFGDICYFGSVTTANGHHEAPVPTVLNDIRQRWRIYYTQHFAAVALQSMLVACVRALRDRPGGLRIETIIQEVSGPGLLARFKACFGQELPQDFLTLTARETLALCGISEAAGKFDHLPISAAFSERALENLLIDNEANEAACIALATILLYQVVQRYRDSTQDAFKNWYERQIHSDLSDISLPEILRFLHGEFGDEWLDVANDRLLTRIFARLILRQHERMSYERGFGGGAPLFNIDGAIVIGTNMDFSDPRAFNGRFNSALQILTDLGFLTHDGTGYHLTTDGHDWLAHELASESSL